MKEHQAQPMMNIESALKSNKVEDIILMYYWRDRRLEGFDPTVSSIGIVATFNSDEIDLADTLSRGNRAAAIYTSYSEIVNLVNNPKIQMIELIDGDILDILRSSDTEEVLLTTPWSGPVADEWDSPAYDDFWSNAEKHFNEKIHLLEKVGKKVQVVQKPLQ